VIDVEDQAIQQSPRTSRPEDARAASCCVHHLLTLACVAECGKCDARATWATAHSRQNGPVKWATQASAEPAQHLASSRRDDPTAYFRTGRHNRRRPPRSSVTGDTKNDDHAGFGSGAERGEQYSVGRPQAQRAT
jgi:hypothetical protein